ncbi:helix-turn-helix domain-containing protein [Planktosalinus lacus]|uniref:Helix-turn-helix domain-containing protein n=1 Tax=Planktosalinus lacus TaxID=1526573 RepID=A0A8J2Y8X6_9FLAO|nr:helix-turn-helix domain-containing protein [Planktosalinus lacus]GGD85901.1 hypothetical protein GCM10011312_07390 [Planktosalinus lacus]
MAENKKSYFAIIPADVRYNEALCANAKLLYGEITALCNEKGYCWANNYYFSELYNVSKRSITAWISELEAAEFIKIELDQSSGNQRKIFIKDYSLNYRKKTNKVKKKTSTPSRRKLLHPQEENFQHNNTVNNTMNRESNALDFLKVNFPSQYEAFLMQNQKAIKDFDKFKLDFNDTVDQEEIKYTGPVLFARLRKYARNWQQNQHKYNKPEEKEAIPLYRRKIS